MKEVLEKILTAVHDNVDLFLKVITTFAFHSIYRLKFDCSCGSLQFCTVYLLVPCLVIWLLLLAVDKDLSKAWARCVNDKASLRLALCKVLNRLVLMLCVSLIWAVSVLVDGDWYVCCREFYGNKSENPVDDTALRTTSWVSCSH